MGADQEELRAAHHHVGFGDARAAAADRLHLPALEHDPGLVALLDEVVVEGFAVFDDRHGWGRPRFSMKQIARSAIVEHSAAEMYALVEDIEAYPRFLPWCTAAEVHERRPGAERAQNGATKATLTVGLGGLRHSFTTLNENRPGEAIDMRLVEGPFRRFDAQWRFVPLAPGACRIEFSLQYEFSSRTLGRLLAPLFDGIADSMVDAFVRRAAQVYEG